MAKIVKTLTISWQWSGDKYSLQGFNLAITPATKNPKEEVVATAFVETKEIKQTYSYKMGNVTLDKDAQYKIWVQAVYENSDSDWVSTGGATVTDDGSATIITKTDREIQDIVNMASDNILTRQEKVSLRREWQEIVYEFLEIESTATGQGIPSSNTAFSNFKTKGNALGTYLNGGTAWTISSSNKTSFPLWINDSNLGSNTSINGNTYRETFRAYYEAKVKILEEIGTHKIDNVQIGATNIIRNSSNPKTLTHWKSDTGFSVAKSELLGENVFRILTTDATEKYGATNRYKVEPNCQYTFAMDVYMDANVTSLDVFWLSRAKGSTSDYDSVTHFIQAWKDTKSKWVRITGTFTTKATDYEGYIRIDNNGTTNSTTLNGLWFTKVKLEKGNKATDWSPALEDMENAYTIVLTNEAQVIPTNSNRVPTSSTTYFTDIQVYKGTEQRNDYTIGTVNSASGITVSKTSSRVNFTVSTNTALAADGGNFIIPITIDGKTFNKTFSWSCSKQGNTGASGIGISKITEYYAVSSSNTTEPTSWSTTVPTMTATNKYLWNYETITYSNNTTTNTSKRVIGVYGDKGNTGATGATGATGNGISKIVNYYLATSSSSGVTTSTSGWTTSVQAVSASKKYLWNYEVITYTNGSTSTTTPCIIGAYGDTGATGPAGQNAQHVVVTGEQVFKYANNFSGTPTPATITLTATKINTTATGKWQWLNGSTWTDWSTDASTLNATTLSVSPTSGSLNTGKSIRIRYIVGSVYDEITLVKVSDGTNGTNGTNGADAYTVILTNETHAFPAQNNGNIPTALSTTTQVMAYKGASSITPTIGNLPSVSGLTLSKSGTTVTVQANTGTSLADSGSFNIPVTVDGKSFTKTFSWSKAKQGNTGATGNAGQDAITIVLSNENHTFPCESNGNIPTALSTTCVVTAYKGGTSVTPTIGTITNPTGMTITKNGATLTIQANTGTSLADSGTVNIPITVDGKTFNKTFTWSKAKKGATGATGATGAGAKTVDIIASSQVFKSTDGGLTFSPTTITMTPKLQNVTYSNWQYSANGGSTWNGFTNSISGWNVSGGVLTINKDCSLFTKAVTSVVFRLNTNDSSVYDTMTIVKLYDVTDLEIGGRNYLQNSNFANGLNKWTVHDMSNNTGTNKSISTVKGGDWADPNINTLQIKGTNVTGRYGVISSNITLVANTTYTISGYCAGHRVRKIQVNVRDKQSSDANIHTVEYNPVSGGNSLSEYYKFETTFTTTSNTLFALNLYAVDLADNGHVWFANVKLEKGNKASDWTPAPEDVATDIDTAKNEAIDSANNTLTTTISNYYTKEQTNSQIDVAKEAINLGVSSTYETKANVETKITSTLNNAKSYADTKKNEAINAASSDATNKVNAAKSELNTAIGKKANSSDVYSKAEVYTKGQTDSAIKVVKDEINLGVSSTYETKANVETKVSSTLNSAKSYADTKKSEAINSAATDATNKVNSAKNELNTKIDSIQIGGRNLALGTGKAAGDVSSGNSGSPYSATDLFSGITAIKTNTAWSGRNFNLKAIAQRGGFKVGDNLILSVYIKSDQNVTLRVTSHRTTGTGNTAGSSKVYDNFTVTPKWQQVWFPFVADEGSLNREDARIEVNVATGSNYIHWAGWKLEKGTKPSDWEPAPEDVNSNIDDVKNSLSSFQNTVNTSFKDGIVEQAEAKAIAQHLKTLDAEKADIDKEYSTIYSNSNLTGSAKTNLASAKTSFDSAHASLKSTINTVISDGRVTSSESASVTSTFNTYNTQLGVYKQRVQEALDNISSGKVDGIKIGGRNLIKKKSEFTYGYISSSNGGLNNTGALNSNQDFYTNEYFLLKNGESICFTSYPKPTVNSSIKAAVYIHVYNSSKVWQKAIYHDTNTVNTTANKVYTATEDCYVRFCSRGFNDYSHMAEYATKPSQWSLAPEDVTANINTAKNEAINSANNTLTTTIANYYTKAQTDSQINVAKDAINLGVSQTYETKANVTTKVSNAVAEARGITDTRNTNQNPQWYMTNYPRQTINEFKYANVIGVPNSTTNYGTLTTNVPWHDNSGGYPVQTFRSSNYKTYERKGTNNTAWSAWVQVENAVDSQAKANTAKQEAINSANNTLNTTIANYYTKTQTDSQIKVAKDAITQSVSSTYETKTEVANKINAIQVGSRNWVQNSAFKSTTGWTLSSGWSVNSSEKFRNNNSMYINRSGLTADSWSELRSNKINVKQGDKLVGSWYIKHRDCDMNSIVELWGYKADGSGRVSIANSYQISGTNANWTRYILKGTVPANVDYVQLAISHRRNGIIYAAMPQVEYGNTATDWSPSPDDMETIVSSIEKRVNTAEQKITDSAIVSTVTSSTTYRNDLTGKVDTNKIISTINQTAEAIKISASKIQLQGAVTADMITSGTFKGVNFEAGGSGSTGRVLVKDANNNNLFSASKNGVNTKRITFVDTVNNDGTFVSSANTVMTSAGYTYSRSESSSSFTSADLFSFNGTRLSAESALNRTDGTNSVQKTTLTPGGVISSLTSNEKGAKTGNTTVSHSGITINGNGKNMVIGTGGADVYIHNSASGKYLQLKDNGNLTYDDKIIYHEGNTNGPVSGNWFSGGMTRVGTDGVMEIGRFIDFHNTSTTTSDYSTRLSVNGDNRNTVYLPTGNGTLCLEGHTHSQYLGNSGNQTINVAGGKLSILGNNNRGHIDVQGGFHTRGDSSDIWFERHIMPSSWNNASLYLGYSDKRWKALYASNGTIQTSDERFKVKQGFTDIEECYEMIKDTDIYNYIMLNQNKEDLSKNRLGKLALSNSQEQANVHMGIMAQDIQKYKCSKQILVEGEYKRADGSTDTMLSINPYGLATAVMGALKVEIQKRELLEEKITKLESLVEQLMTQLVK